MKTALADRELAAYRPFLVASRLNSFRQRGLSVVESIRRMAAVSGLTALELNYPQHFTELLDGELAQILDEIGLPLTALNLRFDDARFRSGAFTAPDAATRVQAVQTATAAVETAARFGARHVVLWMADDGWDYPFQVDHGELWEREIAGFRAVAEHDTAMRVSVEYKPLDPRRFSLIRSMSDALLACQDVGLPNFGVTIDVCHSYMAGEHPPAAAAAALRMGNLFGVHLNDGHGRADDGLLFGSVHELDALELLQILVTRGYEGTLYFDTFPVREEPGVELAANIARLDQLLVRLGGIDGEGLAAAQGSWDAVAALTAVNFR